ncbi:MAG: hypothetical protein WAP03_19955 [Methylorubrum rhodinum]|uniref:hypothetical protein n=1 Tax=Methylorubrum rhodinum TaxID=29428 RepID=UPI003BB1E63F
MIVAAAVAAIAVTGALLAVIVVAIAVAGAHLAAGPSGPMVIDRAEAGARVATVATTGVPARRGVTVFMQRLSCLGSKTDAWYVMRFRFRSIVSVRVRQILQNVLLSSVPNVREKLVFTRL